MAEDRFIVFGIGFKSSALGRFGTMMNLVKHTFTAHFDEFYDPEKWHSGPDNPAGEFGGPGGTGKQVISEDITLYWRNYGPDGLPRGEDPDPGKMELFLNVAFDRFLSENRGLFHEYPSQNVLSVLGHFKKHIKAMIKEQDEKDRSD